MSQLNEYPSNQLGVLLTLLESTAPKLVTERTLRNIWITRVKDAHKDSFESEQELKF